MLQPKIDEQKINYQYIHTEYKKNLLEKAFFLPIQKDIGKYITKEVNIKIHCVSKSR